MSSRKTVYLTDDSEKIIGPIRKEMGDSRSGRLNSIVSRYGRITDSEAPALTVSEWSLLCDMLNGTVIDENTGDYLWADIAEAGRLDGLADKWKIDTAEFSERVRDMSPAARYYILDVVSKFWKGIDDQSEGMEKMLEKAGAKIKKP